MENPIKNERGVVLLVALLVVALCVALVVEINYDSRIKLNYASNYKEELSAYYIARSGVQAARALLETDARESRHDSTKETWAQTASFPLPVGEGVLTLIIEDENRKININNLVRKSGATFQGRRDVFINMLDILEIDESVADCIIDWIDPNDDSLTNGAENSFYLGLTPSYDCKNAYLDSIEELRHIRNIPGEVFEKLRPYITIYTGNDSHINLNTAPTDVLMALSVDLTEEMAGEIVTYREDNSFTNKAYLRNVPLMDPNVATEIIPFLDVSSTAFTITAIGSVDETQKVITAVIERPSSRSTIVYWHVD